MGKLRQRALIADDVGLGKTIDAGLVRKEPTARNRADRVLFVVPAHLQKEWIRDIDRFFDPLDLSMLLGQGVEIGQLTIQNAVETNRSTAIDEDVVAGPAFEIGTEVKSDDRLSDAESREHDRALEGAVTD